MGHLKNSGILDTNLLNQQPEKVKNNAKDSTSYLASNDVSFKLKKASDGLGVLILRFLFY